MDKISILKIVNEILEDYKKDPSKFNNQYLIRTYKIGYTVAEEIMNNLRIRTDTSEDFAYARVSTKDQNVLRQLEIFRQMGIPERHIFIDKQTGRNYNREQYIAVKNTLRKNDRLYILDLKRFGRNYKENKEQFEEITKKIGADIICINNPVIDTTKHKDLLGSLISDIILSVLSYETESDYNERRLNQKQGIDTWKKYGITKTGRPYGRPRIKKPSNWKEVIELVNNNEISKVEAMQKLNLKKDKFYEFYNEEINKTSPLSSQKI